MNVLLLACRVLHIAATCTSLGGLFYARMVLWPTLPDLPPPERELFLRSAIRRFAYIKWSGVIVVVLTGVIQGSSRGRWWRTKACMCSTSS
jgi:uncharacterized membrane protein